MTINPYSDNILVSQLLCWSVINYVLWDRGSIKLILVVCIVQIISYIWLWAQISWTSVLEEERMVTKQGKSKREWQSAGVLCATRRASKTASSCRRKQRCASKVQRRQSAKAKEILHANNCIMAGREIGGEETRYIVRESKKQQKRQKK